MKICPTKHGKTVKPTPKRETVLDGPCVVRWVRFRGKYVARFFPGEGVKLQSRLTSPADSG